jgi:hypothetical protein
MTTNLIGFGDSWAVGAGLANPAQQNYLALMSQDLGVSSYDFSVRGSSIPHLLLQFKLFIENSWEAGCDYVAIFFLTACERDLFFNEQGQPEHSTGPHPDAHTKYINYYATLYTDQLANFRMNSSLLSLRQLCQQYNIQDRYIFGWQTPELWPEIDLSRVWRQGKNSILDLFLDDNIKQKDRNIVFLKDNPDPYLFPSMSGNGAGGHPNFQGHRKIADTLIDWVGQDFQ